MAAWGNLKNIFEDPPMTDSHSPWGQHLPSAPSFEMFGELCHPFPSSTSSPTSPPRKSIATMPEHDNAAAVEIFGELCYSENSNFYPNSNGKMEEGKERLGYTRSKSTNERSGCEMVGEHKRSYSDVRQRITAGDGGGLTGFPPPLTTIGSGGKPRVYFKSFRKDGRFVLREIKIPTQRLLQAKREDGRLTMRVLRSREEEEEIKEGGEEE